MIGLLLMAAAVAASSQGVAVEIVGATVQVDSVTSRWKFNSITDYQVSYEDCASISTRSSNVVKGVQVVFALSDNEGKTVRATLPVDQRGLNIADAGAYIKICRQHGYANGDGGHWLVAWVDRVDYADGTTWHAPPENVMAPAIRASIFAKAQ